MFPMLKAEMSRAQVTGTKLADFLGITQATLSMKMNGKRDFTMAEAKSTKDYLESKLSLDELFSTAEELARKVGA